MNFSNYIAKRILHSEKETGNMSRPIIKIGIAGIALGVAVMIITLAIVTGFQQQITKKITTFTSHLQINDYDQNQSLEPNPITVSNSILQQLMQISNVKLIQPFATKNGILKTKTDNEGIVLKGVDHTYDWSNLKPYINEGTVLSLHKDTVSKQIFISTTLAKKLNIKLNQKMLIYFMSKKKINDSILGSTAYIDYEPRVKDFYVRGIFNTGFSDIDKNLVFVDLKQIQNLNYWKRHDVAGYEVFLKNFDLLEQSLEEVNDKVGYNYTVSSAKQLQSSIFSWLEMIDVNAVVIITLMVLVAAINMISALLILILERTNMIGLLKAFGSSKQAIRTIFFHVSLQLLLKGLIIGNIIGIGFCFIQYFFNIIPLNPATYYLDSVPINLSLWHVCYVNIGTVVTCMIMLFLPTLILNKISPIKAIQFS